MRSILDCLAARPVRFRQQLVGLVWLPVFIVQFVNIVGWLAARPLAHLEYSDYRDVKIPPNAKSYYPDHGSPAFNEHGTIGDDPVVFALWLLLFLLTFAAFVYCQKRVAAIGNG